MAASLCVLAGAGLVSTCRLSDLVNPGKVGALSLTPLQLVDSAHAGSLAPRVSSFALHITTEALPWTLRVMHGSAWLKPSDTTGTAPDTLRVTLDPSGLGAGDYRDTVEFSVAGPTIAPVYVPVEFRVTGCAVVALSPGVLADSLTTADCGAPHRSGRVAKLFSVTGAANDSITLHLASAAFGAYLVLDSGAAQAGIPSLAESGACRAGVAGACLAYVRLPQAGTYVIEATSIASAATGAFALSFTTPRPPVAPDSLAQFAADGVTPVPPGGAIVADSIVLRASLADPDSDSVRVEVEVRPVGTAFTGTATAASAFGPSGARATAVVTGLANFASYRWQARAVDRTGRASAWVPFGGGGADFRVSIPQPPLAPANLVQLKSDGVTPIPVGGATDQSTVLFQALVADPDSGDVVRLEVEVKPVGTAFVDTATVASTAVPRGTVATATITGLADGVGYHWQARAVDETGRSSAWVPFGNNAESVPDFRVALSATQLAVLTQPSTTSAGSAIAPAVQVAVQDLSGNTITSFTGTVTAAIGSNPSNATLSGTTSVAAVAGVATFSNLRLNRTGTGYTLLLSAGTIATTTAAFNVTPGAATALVFTGQPTSGTAGVQLVPPFQVTVYDSLGNVATGYTGNVAVGLGANPAGATLSGTTTEPAAAGVATFSTLTINRAATGYTLAASATGLTGATSQAFNIVASTGEKLLVATQPAAAAANGVALTRQPAIQVADSSGNPVQLPGVTVTAFVDSGPAGTTLAGFTVTTTNTGLATFSALTITGKTGTYALGFQAQGYQSAVSAPITLSAGAATGLAITTEPSSAAQSGVPFVQQPVIQLQDASGNPVPQSGVEVTAKIASGGGTLGGTDSVATGASGAATFTDLSIAGTMGSHTLSFTAASLTGATSGAVALSAGAASQIARFAGDSQSAAVGAAVPVPPAVVVRDASNNPVAGVGVTFAIATGGGAVVPTAAVTTNASGVAAVTSWTLGAAAGANTLTATATGLAGSPVTFHATGVPGTPSAARSVVTVSSASVASGSVVTLTLQAKDSANNNLTVGGATVVFSDSAGTSTGTIGATADSGNGKYTATFTGVAAGSATTIHATVNGAAVTSALPTVTVTPGPVAAAKSVVSVASPTVVSGATDTLRLQARDAAGNNLTTGGATVVFSATGGTSTDTIFPVADAGSGTYTAVLMGRLAGTADTIHATVNGAAVTGTPPTVTVTPGTAIQLAFTTQPASTTAGSPFGVVVTARDAAGNTATGFSSSVTVAIAAGTGKAGASLDGTKSIVAVAGVATFGGLSIDSTGTGYALAASATGLSGATSTAFNVTAGTGGRLVFTTQPASTTAGAAFGAVVTAKDTLGNTNTGFVGTVTLAITAGTGKAGATLLGTASVAAAAGVATFAGLQIDSAGAGYTLTASTTAGPSGGVSAAFTVAPGAVSAAKSTVTASGASVASGSLVTLALQARDAFDNALATGGATVVFSDSGGTSTGTFGATADSGNGKYTATFTGATAGTAATIHASIGGTAVTSALPTVTVTPGPIAAAKSVVTATSGTVASGSAVTVTLTGKDAVGNAVAVGGATVVFSDSGGTSTGAFGSTADSGDGKYTVTFTGLVAGTATTVRATVNGTAVGTALPTITVTPGAVSASQTTVGAAPSSIAASNGGTTATVTVTAKDAAGNPVPGATVVLSAGGSGNTLTQPSGPTNASGVASGAFASTAAGSHTITAVVAGVTATEQPAVTVTAAAAAALAFAVQPSNAAAGAAIAPAVSVQVNDAFGNLASGSTASVTIALATNPGGATLGGTLTRAAVAGVATFADLTVNKVATGYALSATSGSLTAATSTAFAVTASGASQLAFTAQPASTTAGAAFGVTVTARDSLGNTASAFTGNVTVAVTSGTGKAGAALRGTLTVPAVAGVATFAGLSIDSVGTGYTLTASASGATSATSSAFNITPAPANRLAFSTEPASTTAGSGFGVVVTARDSLGNTATGFTGSVAVAITSGTGRTGAALRGVTTVTAVSGVATFSGLSVDSAGAGYTLTASATGTTSAVSSAFTVSAGTATKLAFTTQPVSRSAGTAFGVVVTARDSLGNTATGFVANVTMAITSGTGKAGAALLGTATIPASSGVATFSALSIDSAGTGYTLTASATGPASAISSAFNLTPGAAASLTKTAGDNLTGPVGTTLGTAHQVRVADAFGNAVSGVSVTWAADSGGGSVNPVTTTTDTAGHASTVRTLGAAPGTQTTIAIATIAGLADTVRFHVTATVGGATQMAKAAGDAQADTVGGTLPIALAVKVTDALNNPVSGVTVTWTVTGGGGSVVPPTSVSNDSGLARTSWTLGTSVTPTDSTQTVRATAVGTPSNFIATARPGSVSAAQSTVAAAPGSIAAGGGASTVTVTARDGFGNVIPAKPVVLAATGTGNTLTQPAGNTNANGVATGSLTSTVAETKTVSATAGGVAITQTAAVTVTPAAASAAKSVVTVSASSVGSGGTDTLKLQAKDAFGNNLTTGGAAVVFSLSGGTSGGTVSSTTDNGNGTYAAVLTATAAGTADTVHATIGGTAVTTILPTVTVTAGTISTSRSTVTVSAPSVASGGTVTLTLQAKDASGNNLSGGGATVLFTQTGGAGLSAGTIGATTDSLDGRYVATFTGVTAGTATTIGATIGGVAVTSTLPTLTVTAGSARQLVFTTEPAGTSAGTAFGVVVTARDSVGNPATAFTGSVTVAITAGTGKAGAALRGSATVPAVGGVATFSGLSVDSVGTGYTLTASATGPASGVSTAFAITAAPASALAFTAEPPASSAAGSPFAVTVTARDSLGNTATAFTGTVTVAITGGTGKAGAALRGTKSVAAAAGVASFSGLSVDSVGTGYTLTASATGPASAVSSALAITPAPASVLAFTTEPASAAAGAPFGATVTARDSLGNVATSFVGSVTVAIGANPGGGTLSGTAGVAAVAGVATFSGLSINKSGTGYTLTASATGTTGATSTPFDITGGTATQLAVTTQPPASATAGAGFGVVVTAQDAQGNTATAFTGSVTLAITSGTGKTGASLRGTATVAAVAGVATFSGLSVDSAGTGYTLGATATGPTPATTTAFNVVPGPAGVLVFTTEPPASSGAGAAFGATVTARDSIGNVATGFAGNVTVAIGTNPGGGTLSGTAGVAAVAGVATFSGLSINKSGTGYTLTAAATGVTTGATSSAFNITAGSATQLAFTTQPPASAVAGTGFGVVVTAQDAQGNTASTFTGSVTMAITSGTGKTGANLRGTATVPAVGGVATFSGLSVDSVGSGYTLTASATGPASAVSGAFAITPAPAGVLAFTTQPPASTAAGAAFGAVVTARDSLGNTATGFAGSVTVAIGTNPGGGTLSGTASVTATAGVATFGGLSINKAGTGYTLTASATGPSGATSSAFNVVAATASQLVVTTQPPASSTAGTGFGVVVTAQDGSGNTASAFTGNVALVISSGTGKAGAGLRGTTSVAAVAGVATFSGLSVDSVGTGYTLTATSAGVTGTTTTAFSVTPAPASRLAFTTQPPSSTVSGVTFGLAVAARDSLGNAATGFVGGVTVALTSGTGKAGALLRGATTQTASAGVTTFSGLSVDSTGTGYTISATSGGVTTGVSTAFNVITSSISPSLSPVVAAPGTITASTGASASTITVTVRDSLGNLVTSGVTVTLNPSGVGNTVSPSSATSDGSGVATFTYASTSAAAHTITATAGGVVLSQQPSVTVNPTGVASLPFTVQPSNTVAGVPIAPAVQVQVKDTFNNVVTSPVSVTVSLASNPGSATLGGTLTEASSGGIATFANLTLNRPGTGYKLAAATAGFSGTVSNTFDVAVGGATQLAVTTQPPLSVVAGAPFSLTVTARDSLGNTATSFTGGVTLAITSGTGKAGANLRGTTTVSAASGVAAFPGLSIDSAATGYTITASATGLTNGVTRAITITFAPATHLAFSTEPPPSVASGSTFSVAVAARDSVGNTVTSDTASVTLAIGTNPGGGALSGTLLVKPTGGVATFSGLSINKAGVGYTLTGSAAALTAATSSGFDVTAGTPTQLAIATQPSASAQSGAAFVQQPVVQLQDASGNAVASSGTLVTAAVASGGGALGGTLTATTDVNGTATFTNLQITGTIGARTLSFTATGLTGVTSGSISITAGAASQLAITTPPSASAQSGVAFAQQPVVQLQDASGNAVASSGTLVTAAIASGGAALGGTPTATTDVNGTATFTNLQITGTIGARTLSFTATGLTGVTSGSVSITAGAASQLAITTPPSAGAQSGVAFAQQPIIQLQDASGNAVASSGTVVTAAIASGGGALGGTPTATTDVNGTATFSNLQITGTVGERTLSFAATGLTGATSAPITVSAGATSQLVWTQQPSNVTSGAPISPPVTLTVEDASGNVVTAASGNVTLTLTTPAGAILTGGSATAVSSGVASFSGLSVDKAGSYTLTPSSTVSGVTTLPVSSSFTVSAGGATQLAWTQQPSAVGSGASMTPAVTVTVEDGAGNPVTAASGNVTLVLTSPGGATLTGGGATAVSGGVATFGGLSVDKVGTYTLTPSTSVSGVTTTPASGTFTVSPGAAAAAQTTASVPAGTAGSATTMTVTVRDASGNVRVGSDDHTLVAGSVTGVNAASLTFASAGSGTYTASYTPTVAGSDNIAITLSNVAIGGSPYTSVVSPGAPSAAQTTASVPAGTAGSVTTITITVRDANGNVRAGSNDASLLAVSVGGANTATPTVSSAGSGTYTATYQPTVAGTDNIAITLSTTAIGGSPYTSVVSPGAASTATSTVSASPNAVSILALQTDTITVQLKDANGNNLTTGGASVTISVDPSSTGSGTPSGVTDNGNGTYTAIFTPLTPGSVTFTATVNGPTIASTATITVTL